MTSSLSAAADAPITGENLEQLCARIVSVNPFTDNRSGGVSARDYDVHTIHARQFERLISLAQEAHEQRRVALDPETAAALREVYDRWSCS